MFWNHSHPLHSTACESGEVEHLSMLFSPFVYAIKARYAFKSVADQRTKVKHEQCCLSPNGLLVTKPTLLRGAIPHPKKTASWCVFVCACGSQIKLIAGS